MPAGRKDAACTGGKVGSAAIALGSAAICADLLRAAKMELQGSLSGKSLWNKSRGQFRHSVGAFLWPSHVRLKREKKKEEGGGK